MGRPDYTGIGGRIDRNLHPAWSPNGRQVVYFTFRFNNYDEYIQQLTNPQLDYGRSGIIIYDMDLEQEKWILNFDKNDKCKLSFGTIEEVPHGISWSGDMKYLYFSARVSYSPPSTKVISRIYKLNLGTQELIWISDSSIISYVPVWIEGPK